MYSARAYKIPECTRTAAGTPLVQVMTTIFFLVILTVFMSSKAFYFIYLFILLSLTWWSQILSLSDGERVTSVIPVSEFAGDQYLLMLTVKGYIKKVSLNFFSSIRSTGIIAIQLVFPLLSFLNPGMMLSSYMHTMKTHTDKFTQVKRS